MEQYKKGLKIFHLGLCVGPPPFDSMAKAFKANCSEYRELSTGVQNVNQKALEICRTFKPHIVFMQIQAQNIISIDTVIGMKKAGAWVCNWNGDIRHATPQWMIDMSHHIDRTLFTNMRDAGNVVRGGYLEIGYDPEIYKPEGHKIDCKPIAFFGNNYGSTMFPLSEFRLDMNMKLKREFPHTYGVYGNCWPNVSGNFNSSQAEEASAYRSVKVAISVSHFHESRYTSDRIFRIMGTGVFCLAKAYPDMPFVDGYHLRTFNTMPELIELVKRYGSDIHGKERDLMAKQGEEFVRQNYTFDRMIKNLIEIYNGSRN
jgi:spore maturation protein CgeB